MKLEPNGPNQSRNSAAIPLVVLSVAALAAFAVMGVPGGGGCGDGEHDEPSIASSVSAITYGTTTEAPFPSDSARTAEKVIISSDVTGFQVPTTAASAYLDFAVTSSIIGQQVQADVTRVNLVDDSTADATVAWQYSNNAPKWRQAFSSATGFGLGSDFVQTTAGGGTASSVAPAAVGQWFIAPYSGQSSTTQLAADGLTGRIKIEYNHSIAQLVPVLPRQDYYLTFDLNTSGFYYDDAQRPGSQDALTVKYAFLTANFTPVAFWDPTTNTTTSVQGGSSLTAVTHAQYKFEESKMAELKAAATPAPTFNDKFVRKTTRLRTLDCDDHKMYAANAVATTNDITVNMCNVSGLGAGGSSLVTSGLANAAGLAYENQIKYIALAFSQKNYVTTFSTSGCPSGSAFQNGYCYGAVIDNVTLDPIEQVKFELLDSAGTVLLKSNQDKGFYIDPVKVHGTTPTKLRVTLVRYGSKSPVLKGVSFTNGVDTTLAITAARFPNAAAPKARFVKVPDDYVPRQEWDHSRSPTASFAVSDLRTQCTKIDPNDPLGTRKTDTCTVVMREQKMNVVPATVGPLPARWDATKVNYETGNTGDYVFGWGSGDVVGRTYHGATMAGTSVKYLAAYLARNYKDYVQDAQYELTGTGAGATWIYKGDAQLWITDSATFTAACAGTNVTGNAANDYAAATASEKECCFAATQTKNPATLVTTTTYAYAAFSAATGNTCTVGVFADRGSNTATRKTDLEQIMHIVKLYRRAIIDTFDGAHPLKVNYKYASTSTADDITLTIPQVKKIGSDGEMNDNTLSVKGGCSLVGYAQFGRTGRQHYLCRTAATAATCRTTNPTAVCTAATTDLWNPSAIDAHTYATTRTNAATLGDVSVAYPGTNKRYNSPNIMIDVPWYNEVMADLSLAPANTYAWAGSATVNQTFSQPEVLIEQYAAWQAMMNKWVAGSGSVPFWFSDVRSLPAEVYDPGCSPFIKESTAAPITCAVSGSTSYFKSAPQTWTAPTDTTACVATTGSSHYYRGWGHDAAQKQTNRLTMVGFALGVESMFYQGTVFQPEKGSVYPNTTDLPDGTIGNRCWKSVNGFGNTILERNPEDNGLLAQRSVTYPTASAPGPVYAASQYGANTASIFHQLANYHLGTAYPQLSTYTLVDSRWQLPGENYYAAAFKSSTETNVWYVAAWWVPEFTFGFAPHYSTYTTSDQTFQYLSPYIDKGYTERRLVNIGIPAATGGFSRATLLAATTDSALTDANGTVTQTVTIGAASGSTIRNVLTGVPIGEQPVIIRIDP